MDEVIDTVWTEAQKARTEEIAQKVASLERTSWTTDAYTEALHDVLVSLSSPTTEKEFK